MGKLNKEEVGLLLKGLEYSFKKRNNKKSRSENLNKQIELRESLKDFLENSIENDIIEIESSLGELFVKKLEYRWKNNLKNKWLIDKLKS